MPFTPTHIHTHTPIHPYTHTHTPIHPHVHIPCPSCRRLFRLTLSICESLVVPPLRQVGDTPLTVLQPVLASLPLPRRATLDPAGSSSDNTHRPRPAHTVFAASWDRRQGESSCVPPPSRQCTCARAAGEHNYCGCLDEGQERVRTRAL